MIDFSGQNAIRVALATVLGRFIPGLGVWIANMLTTLLAARLSRQDEYEADAYASALLVKAGIGTGPQKSLFAKLEGLTGLGGRGMPAWLMSHPKTAERIAAIEALEAAGRGNCRATSGSAPGPAAADARVSGGPAAAGRRPTGAPPRRGRRTTPPPHPAPPP
jgi:predicted Zn-dependent protease